MKIGLGTVQFGIPYGVSNTEGKTDESEVARILAYAASSGVHILDTASAYGESEAVLGRILSDDPSFHIVTKTEPVRGDVVDKEAVSSVDQKFCHSLEKLCRDSVYGLLLHQARDMLKDGGDRLGAWLMDQKACGSVSKIGVSVYDRTTLDAVRERCSIDLVQLPLSILDQRFLEEGYLSGLKADGIEIHVRSAFLQGLLLMAPEEMPPHFSGIRDHMIRLRKMIQEHSLSPLSAAIGFVSSIEEVDAVICGVNSLGQLEEIVAHADQNVSTEQFKSFAISDESVLNPSQWQLS